MGPRHTVDTKWPQELLQITLAVRYLGVHQELMNILYLIISDGIMGRHKQHSLLLYNLKLSIGLERMPICIPFHWLVVGTSPILHRAGKQCFPGGTNGKESSCQCKRRRRHKFSLWVRKIPRGGNGDTPVFLPGESHGQRSLTGYSP